MKALPQLVAISESLNGKIRYQVKLKTNFYKAHLSSEFKKFF